MRRPHGPSALRVERASRRSSRSIPRAPALEFDRRVAHVGCARRHRRRGRRARRGARRTRRRAPAQPARAGRACCSACSAPGGCVVAINPERGVERTRADLAALDLDVARRQPRRRSAALVGSGRPVDHARGRRPRRAARSVTAGGTAHRHRPIAGVAVQMLTSGTTGPPKRIDLTYDTLERVLVGAKHYETNRGPPTCGSAPASRSSTRRSSTSAACSACCSASTTGARSRCSRRFDRRLVARRGAPAPTQDREPRARRAAHGARSRPRPCRPREHPVGGLGHRAALPRRRRRVHREVRHPGARHVRGHRVRRQRRRLEPRRPCSSSGQTKRGSVGRAHARLRAARRRRRRAARALVDEEGLLEVKAGQLGSAAAGSAPPTSRASTPTASCGSSAAPTRRSSAAASRSGPTTCASRSNGIPQVRGAAVIGVADRRLGAVPVAAVEVRPGPETVTPDTAHRVRRGRARPLRASRGDPHRRRAPRTASGKVDLVGVRALFADRGRRAGGELTMDLRYSDADEAFRAEVRAWLEREVAEARPAAATRRLARPTRRTTPRGSASSTTAATRAWPGRRSSAVVACPITQQLVYLEEYARADAPYISVNFVGMMHAGPTLIAEGTDEQRALPPPRGSSGASDVWCQGFSEPDGRLRPRVAAHPGRRATATTTSCPARRSGAPAAHVADYCELLVRTDPDAPKHKGITWLILDMHQRRGRGAADAHDRRREPLLRGVPRRGRACRSRTGSVTRTTAGGSPT